MDPDSNSLIIHLVILLVLILINAFFAMSEIAIVTFNDNKLKRMAEDGNKRAATLLSMVTEPSKFLSTIQIGVTLSGFLASASAAEQFADPFCPDADTVHALCCCRKHCADRHHPAVKLCQPGTW